MESSIREVRVDRISPNHRIVCDDERIEELARSIRTEGLAAPLQVILCGESFRIVDGEKRWRACKKIGMERVRAVILEVRSDAPAEDEPSEFLA